jgi:hypothetical protein
MVMVWCGYYTNRIAKMAMVWCGYYTNRIAKIFLGLTVYPKPISISLELRQILTILFIFNNHTIS